jgi:hypothetical protein
LTCVLRSAVGMITTSFIADQLSVLAARIR